MIIKKDNNLYLNIDNIYNKNFHLSNLNEKVSELKSHFTEEQILEYFLTRTNVNSIDNNIFKYTFPIFLLSKEVLLQNADFIIEKVSQSKLNWITEKLGKEITNCIIEGSIIKKLESYTNVFDLDDSNCIMKLNEFYNFVNTPDFLEFLNNKSIQKLLFHYIKTFIPFYIHYKKINGRKAQDISNKLYFILENLLKNNKVNDIDHYELQDVVKETILSKTTPDALFSLLIRKQLNYKSLIFINDYFNNLNKFSNNDYKILNALLPHLLNLNEHPINIEHILSTVKRSNPFIWVNVFKILKDNKCIEDSKLNEYVTDFCFFLWEKLKNTSNKTYINYIKNFDTLYFFREKIIELDIKKIQNEILEFIFDNKELLYSQWCKTYDFNSFSEQHKKLYLIDFFSKLLIIKSYDNENAYLLIKNLVENSNNLHILRKLGIHSNLKNKSEIATIMINRLYKMPLNNETKNLYYEYIKHLDLLNDQEMLSKLMKLDDNMITNKCLDTLSKDITKICFSK